MMNTTGANKPGKDVHRWLRTRRSPSGRPKNNRRPNDAEAPSPHSQSGDRAVVHLKACKGDLPLDAAELAAMTALRINATKAKAPAAP